MCVTKINNRERAFEGALQLKGLLLEGAHALNSNVHTDGILNGGPDFRRYQGRPATHAAGELESSTDNDLRGRERLEDIEIDGPRVRGARAAATEGKDLDVREQGPPRWQSR